MNEEAYVCVCMHMYAYASTCVIEYTHVCLCVWICVSVCVFVCMNMFLQSTICQLCVTSNVQRGSVHKYFISASTFFHSICDIMNLANYCALLPLFDLLLRLKFSSHYNSHDLLQLIYCQ